MNKSIRVVSVACLVLVVILIGNLTRIQFVTQSRYTDDARNKRQVYALKSAHRGRITAQSTVIASSTKDKDGFYRRSYPTDPSAYGAVTGYASDIYGLSGIEKSYNKWLDGSAAGSILDQLTGKHAPGVTVRLTLEPEVQKVAYDMLSAKGLEGAVVAVRPSTGAIVAMASTPSFNPALLSDNATAPAQWKKLTGPSVVGQPLLNHATQTPLPPGSTFKVITTAAALTAKIAYPGTPLTAAPQITLPGSTATLENYAGERCGRGSTASLSLAFALSCNTAFGELGMRLKAKQLSDMAHAFGVDESYDFLGVEDVPGTIGDLSIDSARAQSAIGQRDVTETVLGNAMVAATIAHGGTRMRPYLVDSVVGSDLRVLKKTDTKVAAQPITDKVAKTITALMERAEVYAGGKTGLASKTGTAEHGVDSRNSKPHAWYIAFDPHKGRDIAVAVVVENGGNQGRGATGASLAAPIGRAVIAAANAAAVRGGKK